MRAVTCSAGTLAVDDLPALQPEAGHVLLDVLACGICGSDLRARHHCDATADDAALCGYDGFMRSHERVVLGHEFCGEVVDYGPRTRRKWSAGTPVVACASGAIPEVLGGAGTLLEPGDWRGIARVLAEGPRAGAADLGRYSVQAAAERTGAAYARALG